MTEQSIHARFLAIDEGRQLLSLVDTQRSQPLWSLDLKDLPLARSLQRIRDDRVLVGFDRGFFEVDIRRGAIISVVDRWVSVTSVWRDGDATLVAGTDLAGAAGVVVLTTDATGVVRSIARRDGDYVRLMQPGSQGSLLLCTNDHVLEVDAALRPLRRFAADGFLHAWMARRLGDGTTLVSAGYGAFMAVFAADGSLLSTFGGKAEVPVEVSPFFYAAFHLRRDGTLLVANWQGHGPDNQDKGRQLLAFDSDRRLVGTWSSGGHISSLQGLLVLED